MEKQRIVSAHNKVRQMVATGQIQGQPAATNMRQDKSLIIGIDPVSLPKLRTPNRVFSAVITNLRMDLRFKLYSTGSWCGTRSWPWWRRGGLTSACPATTTGETWVCRDTGHILQK